MQSNLAYTNSIKITPKQPFSIGAKRNSTL